MNKKALGIGAASFALAALPVVGVFADTTRTDTLSVTIEKGCSFAATAADGVNHAVTLGQGAALQDIEGVKFNITCNGGNDGTWKMTALGESGAKLSDGAGHEIESGSGTLDGSSSNWAFKLSVDGGAQIDGTYGNYSQIPGTATEVVKNTSSTATDDATIQAYYGVSASSSQDAGTYTGRVTYTLTNTPSE